jgi:N-acetyl-gamma-glutamyl-phosphate reductase
MKKVFIDGSSGTTGLRIHDRLAARGDLELITLPEAERKDPEKRQKAMEQADVVFLCLPDAAAIEAEKLIAHTDTVVLDTSTAHRTAEGWCYGFPELSEERRQAIIRSKRIAVPGCHASGFIALVYPLVEAGILPKNAQLTSHSLTGYSGGGKSMIADYQAKDRSVLLDSPRQYALGQQHKHLKEMRAVTGLEDFPIFCPIVGDFYSGMEVTVPLFGSQIMGKARLDDIREAYRKKYAGPVVTYRESIDENGFLAAGLLSGNDGMVVSVSGNEERILLTAVYDNLGKGASGAAIQSMNLVLGIDETCGLVL